MSSPLLLSCRVSQFAKVFLSILLPTLAFTQIPSPASSTAVPKSDVRMSDVKVVVPATIRVSTADIQTARVEPETVTVQRGDFVVSLLAENGIRQDSQALALIYDLNPQIEDIREIHAGQKLVVPAIEGSSSLTFALRRGYRLGLFRNLEVKQVVDIRAEEFQRLETTVDNMSPERFSSPRDKTEVVNLISETRRALDVIKSPDNIVSQKVFRQTSADVGFIVKTMSQVLRSGRPISVSDLAQVQESAENVQVVGQEVKAGGSGLVRTTIKTMYETTGDPAGRLKVFYAPKAEPGQKQECSNLSTPLTEAIARGYYVFWAMRGEEKVSKDKERRIRKETRDIALEIPIIIRKEQ